MGWCGNTAWFPGYPLLIAALHLLGVPYAVAAIGIAWAASLATLVLLARWFVGGRTAALAIAAFAPGLVYLYAAFPLSLLCLCGVVFVHEIGERRYTLAAIAGAGAAITYPLGLAAVSVAALVLALRERRAIFIALPALGVGLLIVLAQRLQAGRWTAYLDMAGNYHGGLHNPFAAIWRWVPTIEHASNPLDYSLAPGWQVLVVSVLVVCAVAVSARDGGPVVHTLIVWCLVAWLLPLTQQNQAFWRSEAALVLLAPLTVRWPRRLAWVAVVALVAIGYALARVFFAEELPG